MNAKTTKNALLVSSLSAVACLSMLVGTTYAWFTDEASVNVKTIQTGTLDVDLIGADGSSVDKDELSFGDAVWEPGGTYSLETLKIKNKGNLPVKYTVAITGIEGDTELNEVIDWNINGAEAGTLEPNGEQPITISGTMRTDADNKYMGKSIDNISITVVATQLKGPSSSSSGYKPNGSTTITGSGYEVTIPANAGLTTASGEVAENTEIVMTVSQVPVDGNITISEGETATTYEISLETAEGVKVSSTQPIEVKLDIGKGRTGTILLCHNAEPVTGATYDATTGYIAFSATEFSPYTVVEVSKDALPKADVTSSAELSVTGSGLGGSLKGAITLDTAYLFKTTETLEQANAGRFANWHADFVVTVSQEVPAEAVTLAGSYAAFDNGAWVAFKNPNAIGNGQEIRLLKDVINQPISYWELCKSIPEFKCGAAGTGVTGVTMTVELRLYEANGGKFEAETGNYITIGSYEYTFTK